jgi:hypothetical protein
MKQKLPVIALLLFISLQSISQTNIEPKRISYNGLYHTISDSLNPFRFYLRFYPDGNVIGYTTAGNPRNLIPWFKKDHKSPSKGHYIIKKDSLVSFTLKSEEGVVLYEGILLSGNRLMLDVKSMINKYQGKEEYFFWQADDLK